MHDRETDVEHHPTVTAVMDDPRHEYAGRPKITRVNTVKARHDEIGDGGPVRHAWQFLNTRGR